MFDVQEKQHKNKKQKTCNTSREAALSDAVRWRTFRVSSSLRPAFPSGPPLVLVTSCVASSTVSGRHQEQEVDQLDLSQATNPSGGTHRRSSLGAK